jgi:hypothetical protein
MEFKPAQRRRAKLRLAIVGPSGGDKTYSTLIMEGWHERGKTKPNLLCRAESGRKAR